MSTKRERNPVNDHDYSGHGALEISKNPGHWYMKVCTPMTTPARPPATGDGDAMQCFVTNFHIVMLMGRGRSLQEACEECLLQMARTSPATKTLQACVIAMNPRGEIGAASMARCSMLCGGTAKAPCSTQKRCFDESTCPSDQ